MIPPAIDGWQSRDARAIDDNEIRAVWDQLTRGEPFGALEIVRCANAHPRTFVVERGARAILVVPELINTPRARFFVLHELGHALLWLSGREHEWPRAIDEAAASYVARAMEDDAHPWSSPLAVAARARRLAIARVLDAIERDVDGVLDAIERNADGAVDAIERNVDGAVDAIERNADSAVHGISKPPWALWNDPWAQAAYVEAERIADAIPMGLAGNALAAHLAPMVFALDSAERRILR